MVHRYWFCAEPTDEKLHELELDAWPQEERDMTKKSLLGRAQSRKQKLADKQQVDPLTTSNTEAVANHHDMRRQPTPLKEVFERASQLNEQLRGMGMDAVQQVEILTARLCNVTHTAKAPARSPCAAVAPPLAARLRQKPRPVSHTSRCMCGYTLLRRALAPRACECCA